MNTGLSTETRKIIEEAGFGKSGDIGGQPKKRYWTPDGRVILEPPNLRTFVKKDKDGKVLDSGVRDANLDKGWLLQKPEALKPYCAGCDRWHDTDKEVEACIKNKETKAIQWQSKAKKLLVKDKEVTTENTRLDKVENDVGEIKTMLMKLLKRK